MKKIVSHVILLFGILTVGAAGLRGQVKFGGYLSLEYLKGQAESGYANGSIQNIMAGFTATGVFSQKFGFTLEARALSATQFQIEQAWVGFLPSQVFNLKVGLYLVPFGTWNEASRPYQTLLIGTPLNLQYLYPQSWRELGVLMNGQIGILSYAAYIGNGLREADTLSDGQQFDDNNKNKAVGGRLALSFSQEIQAGVSLYTGKYDDLDQRQLTLEGLDFKWITSQWEIWAEATDGFVQNPESFAEGKCKGYSIWCVLSFAHIQPIGSFQKVKYEDPYHDGGIDLDLSRWTAGLRIVLTSNVFLKAEYEWNDEVPKVKNNLFRVQAALGF
jgi:hypothetical protein